MQSPTEIFVKHILIIFLVLLFLLINADDIVKNYGSNQLVVRTPYKFMYYNQRNAWEHSCISNCAI